MATKVLVVDDSVTARKIVTEALAAQGLKILEAADGNEALACLRANPDIQAIFSDINMPWLNGLEMVQKIKEHDEWRDIPICLLTTESASESLEQAKTLGVNAFLVKPVQTHQIEMVIRSFLAEPEHS